MTFDLGLTFHALVSPRSFPFSPSRLSLRASCHTSVVWSAPAPSSCLTGFTCARSPSPSHTHTQTHTHTFLHLHTLAHTHSLSYTYKLLYSLTHTQTQTPRNTHKP